MSQSTVNQASQIADSAQGPASAYVPTNQRVSSGNQPLSVQSDVPTFPGSSPALTVTATWTYGGSHVTASSIAMINSSSIGVGYTAVPASSGALVISTGNQNVTIKF